MIELSHVSKSFGRVVALRDVCLRIDPGERVAFIGSNGSGKTTLLRSLLGLLRVDGRVSIAGVDVAVSPEVALKSVAYMPQIAPPIEAPVREVVAAICRLREVKPKAVAERASRLGLVLSEVDKVRFRDLSGGTKQKVLAALTLAAEAPILVCDEPTANLDAQARAAFFAELDARPKHHVTLLCSHRLDEVRQLVDRVVELREGRIERDASVEELLADRQRFRVEVTLAKAAPESVRAFLLESGFSAAGAERFESLVTQTDKVAIVARLVREHGASISDLSVYHVDELDLTERASEPRLKVV
ncbi:MAG: ABC transporter ATP-binding protein [Polyangiaceae bacterium]|nr:ABC transporter ATP-binding protein [Polyangiaceae bacterium]MCE7894700.1 ABC transporter ATP-binding protein [Sorangiineae bacterium PRO1]MCL4749421.1 ABC transporter ATP-binding protein [Myxococcales bacterium]